MVERREHLRFACEACEPIRVARERIRQNLQRNVAMQLRVGCSIDRAHSALAQLRGDPVMRDGGPGDHGPYFFRAACQFTTTVAGPPFTSAPGTGNRKRW